MSKAATEAPSKVTISDAGPNVKKIAIEIPAKVVTDKLRDSLDTLALEALIPGFRKGKAPKGLIEKKFGASVRSEAKSQLVSAAYAEAVEQHKLKVVGDPVSPALAELELQEGKPFAFELEIEVMPEFELPSFDGIAIKKPVLEISDDMVNAEIQKLLINEGSLESREKPDHGDYLTGHAVMKNAKDGTEYYNLQGAVVQIPAKEAKGKGMILGVMVDDFAVQFGLPVAGENATVKTTGPEQHEVEAIRKAELVITFTVDRVDRIQPASVEHVVGLFGMESEASLREAIKSRMSQRVMVQQQVVMRQQLAKYLIDKTKIELPKRLSAQQSARTLERRRMELMYRGVEPQKIEEHMAELRAASSSAATGELKLFFILAQAADSMDVKVTEGEMNNRIAQLAMENNIRPEKLRQDLINSNRVGSVFQQIREHKTLDAILAKAKVSEMSAEEFDKTMKDDATA